MTATKQTNDGWWRRATTGQWRLSKEDSSRGANTEYGVLAFSIDRGRNENHHVSHALKRTRPRHPPAGDRTVFRSSNRPPLYVLDAATTPGAPAHKAGGIFSTMRRMTPNGIYSLWLLVLKNFSNKKKLGPVSDFLPHTPHTLVRVAPAPPSHPHVHVLYHQTNVPGDHSAAADYLEPYLRGSWLRWNARRLPISTSA